MFLFPVSQWVGGIFFEHTHRLIASAVGFLTIILAVWLWRAEPRRWVRNLGWVALGAVVLQGLLGGLRVTLLKDQIGIFHACLAQGFFGLLVVIGIATSRTWNALAQPNQIVPSRIARIAVITALAVYLQLALGATMRHQHRDLSILDFPTSYGQWIPDTTPAAIAKINAWRDTQALSDVNAFQIWLQMAHRFGAILVAVGAIAVWSNVRRSRQRIRPLLMLSHLLIVLVICQITLGAWTIWSNKAADIATAHVAVGATIFAVTISISVLGYRLAWNSRVVRPRAESVSSGVAVAS